MIHSRVTAKRFNRLGLSQCLPGLVIFFATVALSIPATAPKLASVFLAPAEPLIAGSQAGVWRYDVNNGGIPLSQTFETAIGGQLVCGSNIFATTLTLDPDDKPLTEVIHPGGFLKRRYQFQLPTNLIGIPILEISNYLTETGVAAPNISCAADVFSCAVVAFGQNGAKIVLTATGGALTGIPNGNSFEILLSCVNSNCWPGWVKC